MTKNSIKKKPTLLLVTYVSTNNLRQVQRNLIDCYNHHSKNFNIFTINLFYSDIMSLCTKYYWDVVIYHSSLIGLRFNRKRYLILTKKNNLYFLNIKAKYRALLVQDEFVSMDLVCTFINKYLIDTVFTVAPKSEIRKIYRAVNLKKIIFFKVLTGYVDTNVVKYVKNKKIKKRPFWIGYRVHAETAWGTFNLEKIEIGKLFKQYCEEKNLPHNIKFGAKNFFLGYNWIDFLLKCKVTVGIEGGSNILDWDSSHAQKIDSLKKKNLNLSKKEVSLLEKNLSKINLKALSPKHLEACITKTCQVLVEGSYNNILKPWIHYIPLSRDYSNLKKVMKLVSDEKIIKKITDRAYNDIVQSRNYTYKSFVEFVLSKFKINIKNSSYNYNMSYGNLRSPTKFFFIYLKFHKIKSKVFIFAADLFRKIITN
jgi:hypothetical protein